MRAANDAPVNPDGRYVLYWMTAARRTTWNFALDRAVERARELERPLVVLEALRCGYRWASDRFHAFVVDGMADNAAAFEGTPVRYVPYVEPEEGAGKGLLEALAADACVVVGDDFPAFFLPRMVAAVAPRLKVRLELVDSVGLLPMRAADRVFPTAHSFRRFLQKNLAKHLDAFPRAEPLRRLELPRLARLPDGVSRRWPPADARTLARGPEVLAELPIDHAVAPVEARGGSRAAAKLAKEFLEHRLERYDEDRNRPQEEVTSGLSRYLHFGHVGVHGVFHALAGREGWSPGDLGERTDGGREGWWGMGAPAEAFLDELVTWREVGHNFCALRDDFDQYESLPDWARATLAEHEGDERPHVYDLDRLERADTHDELWNAAQTQLRTEGVIHNYLRMLWGKKILQWSATPRDALAAMIELNNKYAVDGRDPNSYSGIFWVLGRYDRAWGPERPIFGKIRYMTSENTARKVPVKEYVQRYSPGLFT